MGGQILIEPSLRTVLTNWSMENDAAVTDVSSQSAWASEMNEVHPLLLLLTHLFFKKNVRLTLAL